MLAGEVVGAGDEDGGIEEAEENKSGSPFPPLSLARTPAVITVANSSLLQCLPLRKEVPRPPSREHRGG